MGEPDSQESLSRKDFLRQGMRQLLSFAAQCLPDLPVGKASGSTILALPGALAQQEFYQTCEPFCTACRDVCPRQSIQQDSFGFPYIDPTVSPCVMCLDVPCTKACPTGALTLLDDPRQMALGVAVIELTVCTAYRGSGCRICYDTCPIPDEAIRLAEGLPQVIADQCTGCGACVFSCPTPDAIRIVPKPPDKEGLRLSRPT